MSSSTYAAMVLASSPLLYYKLDEVSGNFADAGSAALTATANGTGLAYQQSDTFGETKSVSLADLNYIKWQMTLHWIRPLQLLRLNY